jgi:hypothetical protein
LIKSQELAGPSCLTAAADDEPLFVLRANDELAPAVVVEWVRLYALAKSAQPGGPTDAQRIKAVDATNIADAMRRWKEAHGS